LGVVSIIIGNIEIKNCCQVYKQTGFPDTHRTKKALKITRKASKSAHLHHFGITVDKKKQPQNFIFSISIFLKVFLRDWYLVCSWIF